MHIPKQLGVKKPVFSYINKLTINGVIYSQHWLFIHASDSCGDNWPESWQSVSSDDHVYDCNDEQD